MSSFEHLVKDTLLFLSEEQTPHVTCTKEEALFFHEEKVTPAPKATTAPLKPIEPKQTPPPPAPKAQEMVPESTTPPAPLPIKHKKTFDIQGLLNKAAPEIKLSSIKQDPHVVLFIKTGSEEEVAFYKNLAKAIHTHLKPTKIFPIEKLSSLLQETQYRLALVPKSEIETMPPYKGEVLSLLPVYSKEEKLTLWTTLQKILSV